MRQYEFRLHVSRSVQIVGLFATAALLGCGAERFNGLPSGADAAVPDVAGGGSGGEPGSGGDGSGGIIAGSGGGAGGDLDADAGSGGVGAGTGGARDAGAGGMAVGGDAAADGASTDVPALLPAPPATWQEHWFEHNQLLQLAGYNDDVAVYFDADVPRTGTEWIVPFLTSAWQYTRNTYGEMKSSTSDGRMYAIFHQGRYAGAHAASCFDASHDFRNVVDAGAGPWTQPSVSLPSWGLATVVESSNNGLHPSAASAVWGGKWTEFFIFDLYTALARASDASAAQASFTANVDTFPQAGTHWFRDWFYPLWRDHGHAQPMAKFFKLTAQYFPKNNGAYARDMTLAEMVHFSSGAAGTDLLAAAHAAFGASNPSPADIAKAKTDFSPITY